MLDLGNEVYSKSAQHTSGREKFVIQKYLAEAFPSLLWRTSLPIVCFPINKEVINRRNIVQQETGFKCFQCELLIID